MRTKEFELDTLRVNASAVAEFLGVSRNAVALWRKAGIIAPDNDERYNLRDVARAYIARLKARTGADGEEKLDDALKFWKIERAKQAVRSWRLQRDREVALVILQRLASKVADLRSAIEGGEDVRRAIDALLDGIADEPAEDIAYTVEGDETGEDE